ncbi:GIY-YIG nuclease family protein [Nitrincola tapanii]|uniref:Excinuclease cho n=1 Tax=Nitrincola tapanii TaxID=1708751 RepID=A0A5A9W119_9GAMM|nr:GIY-YIG nuclease family protein [Nitrincola tapanii]KAA0874417.1 DNA polymerase III subunit epsilon [Nitrincola tapanii]
MQERFAFISLALSGPRPTRDRIRSLALVLVDDDQRVAQWQLDLHASSALSGEQAHELMVRLLGRRLVARNARLTLAFLRNALRLRGDDLKARDILCYTRLKNQLNLTSVVRSPTTTMFEAPGTDAAALALFHDWQSLRQQAAPEMWQAALDKQRRLPSWPAQLKRELYSALPETPGVYLFYGEHSALLYVGKSINLRARILSHFADDFRHDKEMRLAQQVQHIEWEETAGEVGALIREAQLVKARMPLFNRRLRRTSRLYTYYWSAEVDAPPKLVELTQAYIEHAGQHFGLFRRPQQAEAALRQRIEADQLCPKLCGLEHSRGACFAYALGRCRGACCQQESLASHQQRLAQALASLQLAVWPYPGAIAWREGQGPYHWHLVDQWCYLGRIEAEQLPEQIPLEAAVRLDLDLYAILRRALQDSTEWVDISQRVLKKDGDRPAVSGLPA